MIFSLPLLQTQWTVNTGRIKCKKNVEINSRWKIDRGWMLWTSDIDRCKMLRRSASDIWEIGDGGGDRRWTLRRSVGNRRRILRTSDNDRHQMMGRPAVNIWRISWRPTVRRREIFWRMSVKRCQRFRRSVVDRHRILQRSAAEIVVLDNDWILSTKWRILFC